ncbi:hypothetical protein Tsp_07945, partial [Trichinella spiralis]
MVAEFVDHFKGQFLSI